MIVNAGQPVILTVLPGDPVTLQLVTTSGGGGTAAVADGTYGDIVVSGGGTVWTIDDEAVTGDKIAPLTIGSGNIANLAITSGKYGLLSVNNSAIANLAITTGKIAADAVTYDKIQNVTAARLLGRMPGTSGDVQEVESGAFLEFDSTGGTNKLTLRDGLRGDVSLAKGGETYTVEKLQGHKVQTGNPTAGDVLSYHGASAEWQHHTLAQAGIAAEVHAHGNLTSDGKIGSTSGRVIVTGTAGAVQALADGSAGTYLQTNGSGTLSWASVAAGSTVTVAEYTYTSSGSYTKPAGLQYVIVEGVGGGGGGGAGSTTAGGNGGCAGLYTTVVIPEALITTSTLTVTVGTGGGAGVAGGDSEVTLASGGARLLYMPGGRAATNDMRNLQGGVTTNGFGAGQTAANATAGRHGGYGPGGGGPGNTTAANAAGLAGGRPSSHEFTGGNAQVGGGAAGGAAGGGSGTNASVTVRGFGEGAGGGGANTGGAGGAGGNGTRGSGGGGGGRGSTAGGAGGSGGDGFIRIIEVVIV